MRALWKVAIESAQLHKSGVCIWSTSMVSQRYQRGKCRGVGNPLTMVAVLQFSNRRSGDRRSHVIAKARPEASCLAVKRGQPVYRTQTSSLISDPCIHAD